MEFMFRLVNCTKNIKNISNRTILNSIPVNQYSFSPNLLKHSGYQPKFWSDGINLGDTGINLESAGINLGSAGIKLGDTGINLGRAGIKLGDTGINPRNIGMNLSGAGINLGSAGTNLWNGGNELTKKVCFFKKLTSGLN